MFYHKQACEWDFEKKSETSLKAAKKSEILQISYTFVQGKCSKKSESWKEKNRNSDKNLNSHTPELICGHLEQLATLTIYAVHE